MTVQDEALTAHLRVLKCPPEHAGQWPDSGKKKKKKCRTSYCRSSGRALGKLSSRVCAGGPGSIPRTAYTNKRNLRVRDLAQW